MLTFLYSHNYKRAKCKHKQNHKLFINKSRMPFRKHQSKLLQLLVGGALTINFVWLIMVASVPTSSPFYNFEFLVGNGVSFFPSPAATRRYLFGSSFSNHGSAATDQPESQEEMNYRLLQAVDFDFDKGFEDFPQCDALRHPSDVDVTLVTQTSTERLHVMKDICSRWTGPISIVVADSNETDLSLFRYLTEDLECNPAVLTASVFKQRFEKSHYPVNTLRNIALRQAKTSHVIYSDIDLIPSAGLYKSILRYQGLLHESNKNSIVVPAFQLNPTLECQDNKAIVQEGCYETLHGLLPETRSDLLQHYGHPFDEPEPRIFQFTGKEHYYGHSSTGYAEWLKQEPDTLEPILCLGSVRYEPYVVVRRCQELPPYQEHFTGYGKNKVSWMWQFRRSGYHLFRLGDGFVIHYPHPESKSKVHLTRRRKRIGRRNVEVEKIARLFREWLDTEVPDQETLPYCDGYQNDFAPA